MYGTDHEESVSGLLHPGGFFCSVTGPDQSL